MTARDIGASNNRSTRPLLLASYAWLFPLLLSYPSAAFLQGSWLDVLPSISFAISASPFPNQRPDISLKDEHEFTLRHIFHHGTHGHPDIHVRMDVEPEGQQRIWSEHGSDPIATRYYARSERQQIERLVDRSVVSAQAMYRDARTSGVSPKLDSSSWTVDNVSGPNTTDKETVISLAAMAWNAYQEGPGKGEWQDMNGRPYNFSQSFGWEQDGLRGHIFADEDNSTIVVAVKGTTAAVFDGSGTTTNDKVNDNLFFSCCCGQGGQYLWHRVCDCMSSAYTCNQTCVVQALQVENRYYSASLELYGNITQLYPNSQVWMVGHSLGGSTSSLLGLTFGVPVTTFEAPGDALAAARLGLPSPPGTHPSSPQGRKYTGAVHFGHTADPIFMGSCNAATSACTLGGYAMQTQCHTGQVCIYDTVKDKQWRVSASYHKIASVVHDVIEAYDEVAPCRPDDECVDCFNWKYFNSNGSDTTTTTKTSTTTIKPTRTTTCKTPGWWGCLDETTTSTESTSATSPPSTTCLKYGVSSMLRIWLRTLSP